MPVNKIHEIHKHFYHECEGKKLTDLEKNGVPSTPWMKLKFASYSPAVNFLFHLKWRTSYIVVLEENSNDYP